MTGVHDFVCGIAMDTERPKIGNNGRPGAVRHNFRRLIPELSSP